MTMDKQIRLSERAQRTMQSAMRENLPFEVGGILLGHYENSTTIVVSDVLTVPGVATTTSYTRDDIEANRLLARFLETQDSEDPTGYVGEWHVHPGPSGPSRTDIKAIREIAKNCLVPTLALVVTTVVTKKIQFCGLVTCRRRYGRILAVPVPILTKLEGD